MPRPKGSKNETRWTDALRLAVMREAEDSNGKTDKRINHIANKLCEIAMDGDVQAIRLIEERLEGKAKQATDVTSNGQSVTMPTIIKLQAEPVSEDD